MIQGLLKNGPTNDMTHAVAELVTRRAIGEDEPDVPIIQINQAAFSDLRCKFGYDMDGLRDDGWIIVKEVLTQDELEQLFDEIEIPEKTVSDPGPRKVLCPDCGQWKRWRKDFGEDEVWCECDDD